MDSFFIHFDKQICLKSRCCGCGAGVVFGGSGPALVQAPTAATNKWSLFSPVLWIRIRIRIRMDPELLPGSGFGIKVPNPDPPKSERAYTVNKTVNSGLFVLLDSTCSIE